MATPSTLAERAAALGIQASYVPSGGGPPKRVPDATLAALARVLGDEPGPRPRAAPARHPRPRCPRAEDRLGGRPAFGLWANLYSLRAAGDLGVGNLSALRSLVRLAADAGAQFVGLSPLHATHNRGSEVSPYSPLTRLFRNPIYLDVLRVPERPDCPEAQALLDSQRVQRERVRLAEGHRVDYEAAAALHDEVLRALHRCFAARHRDRETPRGRAYAAFRRSGGTLLRDFATFRALEEHLAGEGRERDWRRWPAALRSPRSRAVEIFRDEHAEAVDYHVFAQFELDRQLAEVARLADGAGLAIGLYADLALGSAPSGFDPWAFPDAFVPDVRLGAPPDPFADRGQDWGFPPLHPARLLHTHAEFWRRLLRANLEHAGALRIDHVLGLFRQWWIPPGGSAAEGAYVRFPSAPLLDVLAEECQRAQALAIGEDLGTIPPEVTPTLAARDVLSSRVLLFERTPAGGFRAAARYSRRALVTANTHDLPTLSAWWRGSDLTLARELGSIGSDAELGEARARREADRRALARRLLHDGALGRGAPEPSLPLLCEAVHRFLCATPAPLVGLSLDDLAGEVEPVNVPGVPPDRFPSWTRRMRSTLDALADDANVRRGLRGAAARAGRRP